MARQNPALSETSARLSVFFDPGVVRRGEAYLARVEPQGRTPSRFVARVRGSHAYRALLGRAAAVVLGRCTCPFFEDGPEPCKHLWATLRIAERMGWLAGSRAPTSFRAAPDLDEAGATEAPVAGAEAESPFEPEEAPDAPELEPELIDDEADLEGLGAGGDWDWRAPPLPPRASQYDTEALLARSASPPLSWREALDTARLGQEALQRDDVGETRLHYVLLPYEIRGGLFHVHLTTTAPKSTSSADPDLTEFVHANERARRLGPDAHPVEAWMLALLRPSPYPYSTPLHAVTLDPALFPRVVRELCATGRCHFARRAPHASRAAFVTSSRPLVWDGEAGAYRMEFELREAPAIGARRRFSLAGSLARRQEHVPLSEASFITATGLVAFADRVAALEPSPAFPLAVALRGSPGGIHVEEPELEAFVTKYHGLLQPPPLRLPAGYDLERVVMPPLRVLELSRPEAGKSGVVARAYAQYGPVRVPLGARGTQCLDWAARRVFVRDLESERALWSELADAGVRLPARTDDLAPRGVERRLRVPAKRLAPLVHALLERGWRVEAEGKPYRATPRFALQVRTGIDWLEVGAELRFGERSIALPELLAALRAGETSVVLDDGSIGLLPEEWLRRWGVLGQVGTAVRGRLRFERGELPLVAALVEGAPELDTDAAFAKLRRELERGPRPRDEVAPETLRGELRPYQRQGLAWLRFLERSGFGGCLADDMGLGKTVQLLAHLAGRRRGRRLAGPALIVAPRSVLFNWEREAARFTPELRVLTHWGPARQPPGPHFADHDLVLTTYALVRIDQAELAAQQFSCIVLDEAQAIKNADSHTARAVRSLGAPHRLALTGTPIENHTGELWSLFEFLNPGLLGRQKRLAKALARGRSPDPESAALIARAVRPFLLRRTKAQVAPELPERTEQTLYVDLSPDERRRYDELAAYYRAVIRDKVATLGIERATPHVLQALLRLRQAACHVGLLDEALRDERGAKLDLLLERLNQVLEGGHKALVFSQFTGLLRILRTELERRKVDYEYLDGKTTRREQRVDRFQNDPDLRLFLISLKAGGVGLNLTAADYVFILDPWWNPAIEAQAIDRAHRIGQTRHVVAYRLIAQGTVEEKVEALQQHKRELVRAVLGDGTAFGGKLTREDLELLLE